MYVRDMQWGRVATRKGEIAMGRGKGELMRKAERRVDRRVLHGDM